MDYSVGSVAALISGNVTPNRPRFIKRALTPTKHQPSPNVTPKSELVDDRSIFMSPSVQKKKAIVKKSPKRIFQAPDLDVTGEGDGIAVLTSPKADKVKKHLKDDLDSQSNVLLSPKSPKSPKKHNNITKEEVKSPKKVLAIDNLQTSNENTPKKKKKGRKSTEPSQAGKADDNTETKENLTLENADIGLNKSPKKKKHETVTEPLEEAINNTVKQDTPSKNKKKRKLSESQVIDKDESGNKEEDTSNPAQVDKQKKKKRKKNKKNKKKPQDVNQEGNAENSQEDSSQEKPNIEKEPQKKKKKQTVNPNAITNQDTDSEHESDNEITSETEQANDEILNTGPADESSDEEDDKGVKQPEKKNKGKEKKEEMTEEETAEEIKRTLFVGNVLFSKKCKKEIKKIFNKHGDIDSIRIRTVPVKDARVTPKMAVIKNELHPSRSTVNVYIKYKHPSSIEKALAENNTVLNDHHLRVSRSDSTGSVHDPNCSVFVGNLPFALEDDALRDKFAKCGDIESVRIIRDSKTGAGKGFGYVNFTSKDGVELALAMLEEDLTIKNRILRVKRCNVTNKQKNTPSKFNRQSDGPSSIDKNQGSRGGFQGSRGRGGFQRGRGGFQRGRGGFQSGRGGSQRGGFQGSRGRGGFQSSRGGFQGNRGQVKDSQGNQEQGAFRRIMNKRPNQNTDDGPPNKKANTDQPKEKKQKKEFVGMTAEKKKKRKFNKGDKQKKALSEILTK